MSLRIVFDLDGTLIDSAPDIQVVANKLLVPYGAQITLAQTRSFIGNGIAFFIERMLAALNLPPALQDEMVPQFQQAYLTAFEHTVLYPQVRETLEMLKGGGHAMGVCTNKPLAPCMAVMDHLGLSPYFATFWGGDSLPVRKPHPAPLNAALDALGRGPCVYVGDSEVDAQTAVSAGVPFLLYSEGYRKNLVADIPHTAVFSDFAEVPALAMQYAGSR